MKDKIRVLVVDDSVLIRKQISNILDQDEQIEVIGAARDGEEALKMIFELKPDVVTLDIVMPKMDGLTCLGYIMSECPTPVIMLSAYTQYKGEATIKALEYGAIDFVQKPSEIISSGIEKIASELRIKIKIASKVNLNNVKLRIVKEAKKKGKIFTGGMKNLITIGASTGGPRALAEILTRLPGGIPAGILIVQHMPAGFTNSMAKHLDWESEIHIKEAEEGDVIAPGQAYVAPGDFHMIVEEGDIIKLKKSPPELGVRPAINVTMHSVAPIYGEKNIGVILTGMGADGTRGLKMIKDFGGITFAEHQSSCIVYGMPRSAVNSGVVDKIVPLPLMADEILKLI